MNQKIVSVFIVFFILFFSSCNSGNEQEQEQEQEQAVVVPSETETSQNTEIIEEELSAPLQTSPIEEFNHFLGLNYGDEEQMIFNSLGKFSNGKYTEDSTAFIYYFNRADRVPISVWVNTESGKVITVFMEVISLEENFTEDLNGAINEFEISAENRRWFGFTAEEIKKELGAPAEELISEDGVMLLSYVSPDFLSAVAFKLYPQQDNKCSSVSVNWFYQNQ